MGDRGYIDVATTADAPEQRGWYLDGNNRATLRYWNGKRWKGTRPAPLGTAQKLSGAKLKKADQKAALDRYIASRIARGGRVIHRVGDTEAVIEVGKPVNHVLHLLLSVFTLGLWLIVWLLVGISGGPVSYSLTTDEYGQVTEHRI